MFRIIASFVLSLLLIPAIAWSDPVDPTWMPACRELWKVFDVLAADSFTWKSRIHNIEERRELLTEVFGIVTEKFELQGKGNGQNWVKERMLVHRDYKSLNKIICDKIAEKHTRLTAEAFSMQITYALKDPHFSAADRWARLFLNTETSALFLQDDDSPTWAKLSDEDGEAKAFLINIKSFAQTKETTYSDSESNLWKVLKEITNYKPEPKLIFINLQDNLGGDIIGTLKQLRIFLPPILSEQAVVKIENDRTYYINSEGVVTKTPSHKTTPYFSLVFQITISENTTFAILVNENTASAAEIFAFLMKRFLQERVKIIGVNSTRTFGKEWALSNKYFAHQMVTFASNRLYLINDNNQQISLKSNGKVGIAIDRSVKINTKIHDTLEKQATEILESYPELFE